MNGLLKYFLAISAFLNITFTLFAQNLVSNPSFENSKFSHHPNSPIIKEWKFLKFEGAGICDKNIQERTPTDEEAILCPKNILAIDGTKMLQLVYRKDISDGVRGCYISTRLSEPLQIGELYKVSVQLYWPKLSYIDSSMSKYFGLMTSYNEATFEKSSILRKKVLHSNTIKPNQWNSLEWYIEPNCIQKYLTVGVFKNANWDSLKWKNNTLQWGYYFIDKVSVEKVKSSSSVVFRKFCNEFPYDPSIAPLFTKKDTTVFFEKGNYILTKYEQQKIKYTFKNKNNYKKCILIEGYTSSEGETNLLLSRNRALQVAKYCQDSLNFKPYQLLSVGYGSNKLRNKENSEKEKVLNRRVQLTTINLPPQAMFYRYAHTLYKKNKIDSVFMMLNLWEGAVEQSEKILLYFDIEFKSLHQLPKWRLLSEKIKKSYKSKSKIGQETFLLDSLYCTDQMYRLQPNFSSFILDLPGYVFQIDTADWNFKDTSNQMQINDSLNLILFEKQILNKIGLPKRSQVGGRAAKAALLVLVHSGRLSLMEKYLPIVEQYVLQGEANNELYAILYDKIQIAKNKKQKYGTQFQILNGQNLIMPTENEENLKATRKAVGLD
jgi:outer membrane protein OmpA-like peptidoglycan-associated protein